MPKRRCHVGPIRKRKPHLHIRLLQHLGGVDLLCGVDGLIESCQNHLALVQQSLIHIPAGDESCQQLPWNLLPGLVVRGHTVQCVGFPHPILQHLTWGLDKVPLNGGAGKLAEFGSSAHLMHQMAKLMEVSLHIPMLQQRRFVRAWRWEIAHDGSHRQLVPTRSPRRLTAWLQAEASSMPILALPRMHVHVEPPHRLLGLCVGDSESLHILVPLLHGAIGGEHKSEKLLVNTQQPFRHNLHREILLELLMIHLVPVLLQHVRAPALVPRIDFPVKRVPPLLALRLLDLKQRRHVGLHQWVQLGGQIAQKITDGRLGLRHAGLHNKCTVRLIPQQPSFLMS
mmetsp:Transcript_50513/g.110502  ORF Transcript_50513/g.110502 Transcript_50513/m.110502 type:complete len:340 (+) Transcript_50513:480-1499(+)